MRHGRPNRANANKSEPVVASAPISAATGDEAGGVLHRAPVSPQRFLSAEPASSFNERFEVNPIRWFNFISPYFNGKAPDVQVSSLADQD